MAITRRFIDVVIQQGWQPYIKSHWIYFSATPSKCRAGATITFKNHEHHEYKCSNKTASEIIESAKAGGK